MQAFGDFLFIKTKQLNFSVIFISISLIVYPATVLSIPAVNGLIFSLFVLAGLVYLFLYRNESFEISRDEVQFYLSFSSFFLAALLITVSGGFVYKVVGKYLHVVLIIPVYIYFRHSGIKLFYVWFGLVLGSIVAAMVAFYEVSILNLPRARSLTHPIIFGDLSLVMGCMSMAGFGWFKRRANWQVIFPLIALLCGIVASVLSVARGGWVAVPFIALVFFWYLQSRFSFRKKAVIAAVIIIFMGGIYAIPQTKVSFHIDRTITNLQEYVDSDITSAKRGTSVGVRLEMWQASWKIFLDHPLMGVGWEHYRAQAQLQVNQGLRNRSAASLSHPHSEYFSALVSGGLLGFLVLMLLFLVPARLFIKYIKQSESTDVHRLALAGLVLIVAYMAFGLSEPLLYRSRSVNFFAFYLAVFMAGIYGQESNEEVISHKS